MRKKKEEKAREVNRVEGASDDDNEDMGHNDGDEKEEEEGDDKAEDIHYEIKALEDYFWAVRDIFLEFKDFIDKTNVILNMAFKAIKEIIPMMINGNIDYDRVFSMLDGVNNALKNYIEMQDKLIRKLSVVSKLLTDKEKVEGMITDYFARVFEKNFDIKIYQIEDDEIEEDKTGGETGGIEVLPSSMLKDENVIKEKFGIDVLGIRDGKDGMTREEKGKEGKEGKGTGEKMKK